MGARPSRPVKTTKCLRSDSLMESTDAHKHAHKHTHAYTLAQKSTHMCTSAHSINKQTYHHTTDCSARICQHYKTSNNCMNALHCTCNQPPTFQKTQKTQNSTIGLMASWVRSKNSNFSIYLSVSFHLCSSLSLTVITVFFSHVRKLTQQRVHSALLANVLICLCAYWFSAVLSARLFK